MSSDCVCPYCKKNDFVSESSCRIHMIECEQRQIPVDDDPYMVVGVNVDDDDSKPKDTYELKMIDYVQSINPIDSMIIYDFDDIVADYVVPFDPIDYFITSGEAIIKAQRLVSDLEMQLTNAKKLVDVLIDVRSDAKYLETSWNQKRLLLRKKNPRKRKAKIKE